MSTVESSKPKIINGSCGYVLEDVPHLSDYLPGLPVCLPLSFFNLI